MDPIDWTQVQLRGYPRLCEVIQMMETVLRKQEQTIADLERTVQSQALELRGLRGTIDASATSDATLPDTETVTDFGHGWKIVRRPE